MQALKLSANRSAGLIESRYSCTHTAVIQGLNEILTVPLDIRCPNTNMALNSLSLWPLFAHDFHTVIGTEIKPGENTLWSQEVIIPTFGKIVSPDGFI